MKIKSILALDGFQIISDKNLYHSDLTGKRPIFDTYLAYSTVSKNLHVNYDDLPENVIKLAKSPLVEKLKNNSKK